MAYRSTYSCKISIKADLHSPHYRPEDGDSTILREMSNCSNNSAKFQGEKNLYLSKEILRKKNEMIAIGAMIAYKICEKEISFSE